MTTPDLKSVLHRYLTNARSAVLWKLEGLSEYDTRRPLTPTGTNLLGVVKHLAAVEAGYFGLTFNRPFPDEMRPYLSEDVEADADLWARADESRESIIDIYRRVIVAADATVDELSIDSVGTVPWWGDRDVTLGEMLVHSVAEVNRHAGHIDIVRELVDGSVGLSEAHSNLFNVSDTWWLEYHAKLVSIAESFK